MKKIKVHFKIVEPDPAPALMGGQSFDSDHRSSGLMRTSSKLEHSKLQWLNMDQVTFQLETFPLLIWYYGILRLVLGVFVKFWTVPSL